jgi:Flp pilus assembly protein TadD
VRRRAPPWARNASVRFGLGPWVSANRSPERFYRQALFLGAARYNRRFEEVSVSFPRSALAAGILLAAASPAAAQDWKGLGRMEGRVTDSAGIALPEVSVSLALPSRGNGGTKVKTDKKGRWAVAGLAAGAWNIDFEAAGFAPKAISVNLPAESVRIPPVEVKLERAAPKGPPPELLAGLQHGDEAYKAGRYAEARAEYQKALDSAARPEIAVTLHEMIARCYSQEGNYAESVAHLLKVLEANPANLTIRLLTAQEALRGGLLDKGLELLKGVDEAAIKEPEIFYNIAVMFLNQSRPEDAITYLTKAVTLSPTFVDGYFQRGLAYLQLQKLDLCRADLRKVLELAPGTPQAQTAQKALEQLK